MLHWRLISLLFLSLLLGCSPTQLPQISESNLARSERPRYPKYVVPGDFLTVEDEFYFHYLNPLCDSENLSNWPLVQELSEQVGAFLDAPLMARLSNDAIHLSDQKRAAPIIKVVQDCAAILGVAVPPEVYVIGGEPRAKVCGLRAPHSLILTSGLLDLYEERPEELRFLIGRELGHIKANHLRTHFLGSEAVVLLGTVPRIRKAATELMTGRLLHWYRESEISADRAGLICVAGNLSVATQALLRLSHQTKASNKLFDPAHPDFDPELVIRHQLQLREEKLVKIISYLQQSTISSPFIPERIAYLMNWHRSSEFNELYERDRSSPTTGTLMLTGITVEKIPSVDYYVPGWDSGQSDPFVRICYRSNRVDTSHLHDVETADWSDLDHEEAFEEGRRLILELYDYNAALPERLIGSCVVPIKPGKQSFATDVRLDVLKSSKIVELPQLTLQYELRR
jgi:Zn-dependent protease with chaperone function